MNKKPDMHQMTEEEQYGVEDLWDEEDFWEESGTRWDVIVPALVGIAVLGVLIFLDPLQWLVTR